MRIFYLILSFSLIQYTAYSQNDSNAIHVDSTRELVSNVPGFQADTGNQLDDLEPDAGPDYEQNVFKGTRVINSQSTEMIGKSNLDFRICHRFGQVNWELTNYLDLIKHISE